MTTTPVTQHLNDAYNDTQFDWSRFLQGRLEDLKNFDPVLEVQTYTDDLVCQVELAAESYINHAKKMREQLLREIDDYRAKLLHPAKHRRTDSPDANQAQNRTVASSQIEQDLRELEVEICAVCQKDLSLSENKIAAERCESRAGQLLKRMRLNSFHGSPMLKFEQNRAILLEADTLGKLIHAVHDDEQRLVESQVRVKSPLLNCSSTSAVKFLPDGRVVIASKWGYNRIWGNFRANDPSLKSADHFTDPDQNTTLCFALLSNGYLAGGISNGWIRIWDVSNQKLDIVRILKDEHQSEVDTLLVFNDNLISQSTQENKIIIWTPFFSVKVRISTSIMAPESKLVGVLSNGFLVLLSLESANLSVCDHKDGKLVHQVKSIAEGVINAQVLTTDQVAVATHTGKIHIYDLALQDIQRTLDLDDFNFGSIEMRQLSNGMLVAACSKNECFRNSRAYWCPLKRRLQSNLKCVYPSFQIWNLETGKLVNKMVTWNSATLFPFDISGDGKNFVTGNIDDDYTNVWNFGPLEEYKDSYVIIDSHLVTRPDFLEMYPDKMIYFFRPTVLDGCK